MLRQTFAKVTFREIARQRRERTGLTDSCILPLFSRSCQALILENLWPFRYRARPNEEKASPRSRTNAYGIGPVLCLGMPRCFRVLFLNSELHPVREKWRGAAEMDAAAYRTKNWPVLSVARYGPSR